jgi:hypothetical protein
MKRAVHFVVVSILASGVLVFGQGADVARVLADVRKALGGEEKLAAVTSLTATGQSTRVTGDTSTPPADFEMALQLPDKFMRKEVIAVISGATMSRTSGFNGSEVIDAVDAPPMMGGGNMVVRTAGSGPMGMSQPPEQQAAVRQNLLKSSRQEFARLTLGMFASSLKGYPLTFTYAGQAEAPDGKADVIEVKGEGDFAAKLFIDATTHLPLMLSWMAREPMVMRTSAGPGGTMTMGGGGGARVVTGGGVQSFGGANMTPEQREQLMKDMDARMKEAEAQRRTVEFRMYYQKYQTVDGLKLPTVIQRSIDGKPADEITLDKIKLNPKIDPKKFETAK